jgi:hypothetical protein
VADGEPTFVFDARTVSTVTPPWNSDVARGSILGYEVLRAKRARVLGAIDVGLFAWCRSEADPQANGSACRTASASVCAAPAPGRAPGCYVPTGVECDREMLPRCEGSSKVVFCAARRIVEAPVAVSG